MGDPQHTEHAEHAQHVVSAPWCQPVPAISIIYSPYCTLVRNGWAIGLECPRKGKPVPSYPGSDSASVWERLHLGNGLVFPASGCIVCTVCLSCV